MRVPPGPWLLALLLGCGARSALTEPSPSDGADGGASSGGQPPVGGDPSVGGQPDLGGAGGAGGDDECTAPPAAMATWNDPLAFLTLLYTFNDDAVNSGPTGNVYDGEISGSDFSAGMFGQAIRVGAPGFVSLPGSSTLLPGLGGLTVAFWFRVAESGGLTPVFDCRSQTRGFHTYRSNAGITTCWGAGAPEFGPGGCVSIDFGDCDWHHLIFRKLANVDVVDIYLDGNWQAEIGELGFALFGGDTSDILLGAGNTGSFENSTTFEIDELRLHKTAIDEPTQCAWLVGGTWQGKQCVL